MKRPLLMVALCVILADGFILTKSIAFIIGIVFIICYLLVKKKVLIILSILFFIIFTYYRINQISNNVKYIENNKGNIVNVQGRVISIENRNNKKIVILLNSKINSKSISKLKVEFDKNQQIMILDRINFKGRIEDINEKVVPGIYNEKLNLMSQNILAKISYLNGLRIEKNFLGQVFSFIYNYIDEKLDIANKDISMTLKALFFGSSKLEGEVKNIFNRAGVAHIFAISGMHFMFFASLLEKIFQKIIYNKYIRNILIITILLIYLLICSISISALRAFIMFLIFVIARFVNRSYDTISALGFTAILQIVYSPHIIYSYAFILSYSIVFIIGVINELHEGKLLKIILGYLSSLPILAWCFYEIPIYVVISSFFMVPIVKLIMVLVTVGIIISPIFLQISDIILYISAYLINLLIYLGYIFSNIPYSKIITGRPSIIIIFCIYICIYILSLYHKKIKFLLIGVIFFLITSNFKDNDILFMDIKDKKIEVIKLDGVKAVISSSRLNDFEINNKLKSYLKFHKISDIDIILDRRFNKNIKKNNIIYTVENGDVRINTGKHLYISYRDGEKILNGKKIGYFRR